MIILENVFLFSLSRDVFSGSISSWSSAILGKVTVSPLVIPFLGWQAIGQKCTAAPGNLKKETIKTIYINIDSLRKLIFQPKCFRGYVGFREGRWCIHVLMYFIVPISKVLNGWFPFTVIGAILIWDDVIWHQSGWGNTLGCCPNRVRDQKGSHSYHHLSPIVGGCWWFQPNWKICSSNWIISPSRCEHKKKLKPHLVTYWHPSEHVFFPQIFPPFSLSLSFLRALHHAWLWRCSLEGTLL